MVLGENGGSFEELEREEEEGSLRNEDPTRRKCPLAFVVSV